MKGAQKFYNKRKNGFNNSRRSKRRKRREFVRHLVRKGSPRLVSFVSPLYFSSQVYFVPVPAEKRCPELKFRQQQTGVAYRPQAAQARNMSIGDHRHCCVTFKI